MLCHKMELLKNQLEPDTENHAQARSIRSTLILNAPKIAFA